MDKLKKQLNIIADENEKKKIKKNSKMLKEEWDDYDLKNPYMVVREFIKEKGLKLYGGQALHEHLVLKDGKGLYKKDEFPDYDVFSPDAWDHAKELSKRLFEMGYSYVEAKPSILNDKHHQTYKVSVDFLPMLDLTQAGCPIENQERNKCRTCSIKKKGKCVSVFNEIPATNVENRNELEVVYKETFDYETKQSKYPKHFFVTTPDWLKTSMYWELTEPLGDTSRLAKVGTRLAMFEKYFETKFRNVCPIFLKNKEAPIIPTKVQTVLDYVKTYIEDSKMLVEFGPCTHNYYMDRSEKKIPVINYQVYSSNDTYTIYNLMKKLEKKFKDTIFKTSERQFYWKQYIDEEIRIFMKHDNKYHLLINVLLSEKCMPYVKHNNMKHASLDVMLFNYSHRKELPVLYNKVEGSPFDYECLMKDLMETYKKNKKKKTKKFQRYGSKCVGDQLDKRIGLMMDKWSDKKKTLKQTKYYVDTPEDGMITKVYPIEKGTFRMPFKPSEIQYKNYYYKNKFLMNKTLKNMKKLDAIYSA